jgi:hypothetical protein
MFDTCQTANLTTTSSVPIDFKISLVCIKAPGDLVSQKNMAQDPRALLQKVAYYPAKREKPNTDIHSGRQSSSWRRKRIQSVWRTTREVGECGRSIHTSCKCIPHAEAKCATIPKNLPRLELTRPQQTKKLVKHSSVPLKYRPAN